jgi:hypothetical protein
MAWSGLVPRMLFRAISHFMSSSRFYTHVCRGKWESGFLIRESFCRYSTVGIMTISMVRTCAAHSRRGFPFFKRGKTFARRKGRSNTAFIFDIFRAKSRSDFSPEKGWSLKKGRGFKRQPLPFFTIQPRLMAPRLNTCGVEVFSEHFYIYFSSLRLPIAHASGARQFFMETGTICRELSSCLEYFITRTAAGK